MVAPFPFDFISVLLDQSGDFIQLVRAEIPGFLQLERAQPELSVSPLFGNMDVDWLTAIQTEEKEPIPPQVCENRWHAFIYPASRGWSTCFSLSWIVRNVLLPNACV
jgi:hypothetical protein